MGERFAGLLPLAFPTTPIFYAPEHSFPFTLLGLFCGGKQRKSLASREISDNLTARFWGWVAQLVEQRTENPRVPGSIPGPATTLNPVFIRVFGQSPKILDSIGFD